MKSKIISVLSVIMACVIAITGFNTTAFAENRLSKPKVSISTVSTSNPTLKLSWKKVEGANKYYIYRRETKTGKLDIIAKTPKLYYKDTDVTPNKTYYYKVRAYKISNGKIKQRSESSSTVSRAVVKLNVPTVTATTKSSDSIDIKVNGAKGVDRYYLYYSTRKDSGYKCIGYTTENSYTFKDLKASTTYYFKVRTAKVVDGKIYKSSYSKANSCKTHGNEGEYIVDFEKIPNGEELPNGSYITCLAMLLKHYGVNVDKMELYKYFKYSNDFYYKDGKLWGPNPYVYFVGDPTEKENKYGVSGRNVYNPMDRYLEDNNITNIHQRYDIFSSDSKQVKSYLYSGNIMLVVVISSKKRKTSTKYEWLYKEFGDTIGAVMYSEEKYAILCGYTETEYIFYDPKEDSYFKMDIPDIIFSGSLEIYSE